MIKKGKSPTIFQLYTEWWGISRDSRIVLFHMDMFVKKFRYKDFSFLFVRYNALLTFDSMIEELSFQSISGQYFYVMCGAPVNDILLIFVQVFDLL